MVPGLKIRKKMKKTIMIPSSENASYKHNLKPIFVAIRRKHAKDLYQIYSSIIQHFKTVVAEENMWT